MSVAFIISFAAVIYSGPLAPDLSRGIGLALIGAIPMAALPIFLCSYPGTVFQPQSATTVLLAISAGSIATTWHADTSGDLFATVSMLLASAALITAIAAYLFGKFRLGFLARFIPYPVIGGFLCATGYLLFVSGIEMIVGTRITVSSFNFEIIQRSTPWVLVAILMVVVSRRFESATSLMFVLLLAGFGFFAFLLLSRISLVDARSEGLLLGPFSGNGFLVGLTFDLPLHANWWQIFNQLPTILAVAAMALLGILLSASGIEVATDTSVDFEKDLKAASLANVTSGLCGGLIGYHIVAETVLATKMGLKGRSAGLSIAAGCAITLIFGACAISYVPTGLVAAVIMFLGIDFLYTWLVVERRRLPSSDNAIIVAVLAVAATFGFIEALSIGVLIAATMFIISYSQISVIHRQSTLSTLRSRVERSRGASDALNEKGRSVVIYELSGFLFFGTANRFYDQLVRDIQHSVSITRIVIDFSRTVGIDTSAIVALSKISRLCVAQKAALVFTGMSPATKEQFERAAPSKMKTKSVSSLDTALAEIEDALLQNVPHDKQENGLVYGVIEEQDIEQFSDSIQKIDLDDGETLIQQGERSSAIYLLNSGRLRAEVANEAGRRIVISRFLPGALVGEIAYYASLPRSAHVVAERAATVFRIDLEQLGKRTDAKDLLIRIQNEAACQLARRLARSTKLINEMN